MLSVTKRFKFPIGHRLLNYAGDCKNVHGHNLTVDLKFSGYHPDVGMVIDFGIIKKEMGQWLDYLFDHAFLVNPNDESMIEFLKKENSKHFVMPEKYPNPTMENLAVVVAERCREFCKEYNDIVPGGGNLIFESVRIYESDTGWTDSCCNY